MTAAAPGNGSQAAPDPRAVAKGGSTEGQPGLIQGLIAKRAAAATEHALDGPNQGVARSSPSGSPSAITTSGLRRPVGSVCLSRRRS